MRLPVLAWPWLITLIAFAAAFAATLYLGLAGRDILTVYLEVSLFVSLLSLLAWMILPPLRSRAYRGVGPLSAGRRLIGEKAPALGLTLLAFPLFMTAFTTMKTAFPFFTGYQWDRLFTDLEAALFFGDPWRHSHALIGPALGKFLSAIYSVGWGFSLAFAVPFLCFNASVEKSARAMAALMLSWLVGGVVLAALFSSAGPVFAHFADPDLRLTYEPLRAALAASLGPDNTVVMTQQYLATTYMVPELFKGGGISAMPSMHIAVALWLAFVAPKGPLRWLAIAQWIAIWVGSVHFGYHYALDGALGSLIAWAMWRLCVGPIGGAGRTKAPPTR